VSYFRVFGCLAHVHVPDNQRVKLDDKSIKCVHLGVSDESKAYKLYDPAKKKIVVSRDVVFEESKGWKWDTRVDKNPTSCETDDDSSDNNQEEAHEVNSEAEDDAGNSDSNGED
jgi:hypothetical protein